MISEKQIASLTLKNGKELLQGRVASILNAKELVINIGANKGVQPGMKFAIMAGSPMPVSDPETGEVLDMLDREKVRVEAVEIREKISICRTFRTREIPTGYLYDFTARLGRFNAASDPPKVIEETLKAQDTSFPPPLSPDESYVKINDRVVQVS